MKMRQWGNELRAVSLLALVVAAAPARAQRPDGSVPGVLVGVGAQLEIRLQTGLNSGVAKLDQRFEAITIEDLRVGEAVAVPGGSIVRGFVSSVRASTQLDHKGTLTLSFDQIVLRGSAATLRASIVQALDGRLAAVGPGASLLGGGKPPLAGVIVTEDGTIASTEASNVDLPVGTILRIRIDKPLI